MAHPQKIDLNLVHSQRARRAMDRIVGYKITPFIWKTVYYGLSAGRVQSVALRLICEREGEISKFVPVEYWTVTAQFQVEGNEPFYARLTKIAGEDPKIPETVTAEGYVNDIRKQQYSLADVQKKNVKRNPLPPFITSTLQQEAASRLRFSAKRTMMLAQKLYEGVDLGNDEIVGLITYMRTDSTRLSEDAVTAVRSYIYDAYGPEFLPKEPRLFKKGKSSQDAHEAIRPTSIAFIPKTIKKHLDKDLYALYELIWNRFVACQMSVATFEQATVDIIGGEYTFRATGSVPLFRGFLQVYDDLTEEASGADDSDPISRIPPNLAKGQRAGILDVLPKQHFTKPVPRYTEASLVKELESLGIGRPSTYAMIVSTILNRNYVEQKDRKLFATELGMVVTKILVQSFPHILNVRFTALMEEELETVASGSNTYVQVLNDFYHPFIKSLEKVEKEAPRIKQSLIEQTDEKCELCGKPMIIKWGRNGRFIACSGYPACKNTKPLAADAEKHQHLVGMKCRVCGGDMIVKGGRFGTFLGCSNYPTCTNTQPISMGIKCPKCKDGDVIERKTKRKRSFYGCSRYPDCDFVSWDKPVLQECENCKNPYLVSKVSKKKGEYLQCPECKEEFVQIETAIAV
jgi:DNA topoisomerase-1